MRLPRVLSFLRRPPAPATRGPEAQDRARRQAEMDHMRAESERQRVVRQFPQMGG